MSKSSVKKKAKWAGYVPFRLDKAIKARVKDEMGEYQDALSRLVWFVDNGCKVSIEWDWVRDCFFVQAFRIDPDYKDAGLVLAARHQDLHIAIWTIIVVSEELYDHVWPAREDTSDQYVW